MKKLTASWWMLVAGFLLSLLFFSWWSYGLTAPNLVFTSWPPYWNFQTWMWQTLFENRPLNTYLFTGFVIVVTGLYVGMARLLFKRPTALKSILMVVVAASLVLSMANTALSYDVFNYIFNAKMVQEYDANPHRQVALDFPQDDWIRFMHNTHTPAPYGYGWTAFSLLPYVLGGGKFTLTWGFFRVASLLSYWLLIGVYWWYFARQPKKNQPPTWIWWLALANPLLLVEIIGTSHNDLWMMVPAVISLLLVYKDRSPGQVGLSAMLLGVSISIKLATVVLLPVWLWIVLSDLFKKRLPTLLHRLPVLTISSVALFAPLLSPRSKQFLPWYLTWAFVWLPLIWMEYAQAKSLVLKRLIKTWMLALILFSISSQLRYLPYLWHGNYQGNVEVWQKSITWSPILVLIPYALYQVSKIRNE